MSDAQPVPNVPAPTVTRPPFPVMRLLYAVGYAVLAWFVFWAILFLGLLQFVVILVEAKANQELKGFIFNLVQYLWELLAYIAFIRDEQPFPVGPFPKSA